MDEANRLVYQIDELQNIKLYHAEDTTKSDIENRLKKEKNNVSIMGKRI